MLVVIYVSQLESNLEMFTKFDFVNANHDFKIKN